MANVSKPRKSAKPPTVTITFQIGEDRYHVVPLAAHPEVAQAAYRFRKLTGGQEVYDVRLSPEGHAACDCPGCTYHRKPCKHLRTLAAAGMLPRSVLQPTSTGARATPV
jgi:hypothetical protein